MAYNVIKHIIINQSGKNKKSINFQFDFGIVCNKSVQRKDLFPQYSKKNRTINNNNKFKILKMESNDF